jgi:hypothetical protein
MFNHQATFLSFVVANEKPLMATNGHLQNNRQKSNPHFKRVTLFIVDFRQKIYYNNNKLTNKGSYDDARIII